MYKRQEQGGAIIGSTINKYAYCSIVPREADQIVVHSLDFDMTVKYNTRENYVYDGKLDLVTAALNAMEIKQGCEVYLQCDAPPGSGLGTSSCLLYTSTYLNSHEALLFKLRRKLGAKFNEKYPKGSLERKKLSYKTQYVMHPIRSYRFYSTPEGKNLREGDFKIGDVYREHGKLKFPEVKDPMVSVIIPVYNQIHYTYALSLIHSWI